MNQSTDHQLMLAVREGDLDKLGLLFEQYHKHLYNFFLRQTRNPQESEDLVQDVFFRMLNYRHTIHTITITITCSRRLPILSIRNSG